VIAALLSAGAAWVALRPGPTFPVHRGAARVLRTVFPVAAAGLVLSGVTAGAVAPSALTVVLAATAWGGHRLWRQRALARGIAETQGRVLECCDLLASELAAGQPPDSALARAAETWPELSPVSQSHAYGGDVPSALRRVGAEPGAEGMALVAAAWHVSHRTGHGLADALTQVAQALREARATDRIVRGELASARATARLVAALPLVALLIGSGSGGDPLGFLLGTPLGIACLAGGLALGLAGLTWIERIAAGIGR
jgi:tight adherence protein B